MARPGRPRIQRSPEEISARREQERQRVAAYRKRMRDEQANPKPEAGNLSALEIPAQTRDLIEQYLAFRSTRLLSASQEAYRSDLLSFIAYAPEADLIQATRDHVAQWLTSNIRDPKKEDDPRPWNRRTGRRKLSALRGFYRWTLEEDLRQRDPTQGVTLARTPMETPPRLPEADWHRLLDHVETQIQIRTDRTAGIYLLDGLVLHLMYTLALRVSEAHSLRRSRIRYNDGELRARIVKKGDKVRSYPLVGTVLAAYERWMRFRESLKVHPQDTDFVCIHPWTGRRTGRKRAWRRLRHLAREAGLPPEAVQALTPHKLRHARAYHLIAEGEPITAVQSLLDHEDLSSTNIYVRDDERGRLEAIRRSSTPGRSG